MNGLRVAVVMGGALTLVAALSACGGDKKTAADICDKPQEYQASRSVDDLSIPKDLDEPDRSGALVIPDEHKAGVYPDGRPCLERPPDYFGR
ncbi:MAG: hypothetical protein QNJ73_12035 [Gammaproteobacteria bacterium]|nr:hypothetical protein [Gammaproteobacteria bacterium]